jgi:hypothetical protein
MSVLTAEQQQVVREGVLAKVADPSADLGQVRNRAVIEASRGLGLASMDAATHVGISDEIAGVVDSTIAGVLEGRRMADFVDGMAVITSAVPGRLPAGSTPGQHLGRVYPPVR